MGNSIGAVFFPNPTSHSITINLYGTGSETCTVECFNALGEKLFGMETTTSKLQEEAIDLSSLAPGIYFLNITCGDTTIREKICKQ
jgi:hypothetical protein